MADKYLILFVGLRHPVKIEIPEGIRIKIPKSSKDQKIILNQLLGKNYQLK